MEVNPLMFREYDIRGVVGQDLTVHSAELIGKGFGTYLRELNLKKTVIGRDCRLSSDELFKAIAAGLNQTGCDVIE